MKKSWLRSLLVVVMALLLVFTLVACTDKNPDNKKPNGGDDDNNNNNAYTSAEYFDNLWTLTSKIGNTAIGATDDLAVKFGVQVSLDTISSPGSQQMHQIDLGLEVQAVVGRTADTARNTALKVKLYDPTDAAHTEIATLYAFANDIDNLYIDFGGQNIKVSHNVAKYVFEALNTDTTATVDSVASISKEIYKALSNKFIGSGDDAQSINDVINSFVGKFGANWSLNTLVNGVLDMLPFDINSFIQNPKVQEMLKMFVGDIELVDEDGHINIIEILKSENVGYLFAAPTKAEGANGSTTHKIALSDINGDDDGAMGLLGNVDAINALFGGQPNWREVAMSYVEKDSKIDSFSISAKLGGLKADMGRINNVNTFAIPCVTVTISDLKVEKYNANTNAVTKQAGKTYTSNIAVNEKLTLEGHGIKINAIDGLTENDIYLNGKVELGIVGMVDLVNVTANGTKLYAYVDLTDDGTTENVAAATPANKTTRLAEISYVNGKFAGKLYKEVSVGGQKYQNFYWEPNFNIATAYKQFVTKTVNDIKAKLESGQNTDKDKDNKDKDENKKESEWSFGLTNWIQAIQLAIPMLKTDNNIEITSNDALATVVAFANAFGKDWSVNNVKQIVGGKEEIKTVGREEFIIELLTAPMEDDLTMDECFDIFMDMLAAFDENDVDINDFVSDLMKALDQDNLTNAQRMEIIKAQLATVGIDFDEVKSAAFRVLYLCALQVEIEGVEVPTTASDDEVDLVARYIENIKAVLHSKVTLKADAQNGAHLSLEVKIADAVLSITESLEVIKVVETGDNATFKNLYPVDKTGWTNVADFFAAEEE